MRLFIAICLDDNIKNALIKTQNEALRLGMRGNLTPAANMHITLAFIGEYERPEEVLKIMRSVRSGPFDITLQGCGSFGDILWCGVSDQGLMKSYAGRLRKQLDDGGIPFDGKPFRPHITLARKTENLREGPAPESVSMTVKRVSLMRSDRGSDGKIRYKEVGCVLLA